MLTVLFTLTNSQMCSAVQDDMGTYTDQDMLCGRDLICRNGGSCLGGGDYAYENPGEEPPAPPAVAAQNSPCYCTTLEWGGADCSVHG